MTTETLAMSTLVVPDYDAGIAFYAEKLGFKLVEDTDLGDGKRWVVVEAPGANGSGGRLLLARDTNESQTAAFGNQTGGPVAFFLHTDDFASSHERFIAAGVEFMEEPRHEPYATVAAFADPFGNTWDLIEAKDKND
ncbi:VOC family protein [Erythrobacter sp. SCSIO 43205]|uniref:VOC family protein n=1 Tax=Erythrobacter sp. SCSIO 43205 TaxID=2779361 RepID=UPI001CA96297|nr:VOC family protein [Erythrobacter sp. SCSIO 43205]UAB78057.1 VOC family protein [Erythrobacter sp. SCSIO 43205]